MADTLLAIRNEAYFKMAEKSTSSVYTTELMTAEINRLQRDVCQGIVINQLNNTRIIAGDLPFMRRSAFYNLVPRTTLTSAVDASADNTVSFNTTNFASSGTLFINGDIITYTGKTSTTATGASGIGRDHYAGEQVGQLYDLPNDYEQVVNVFVKDNVLYDKDEREKVQRTKYYQIVIDTDGTEYLDVVGYSDTKDHIHLLYHKACTDMSADGDTTALPDDYGVKILSNLVAGKRLYDTEESARGAELLQEGYAYLSQFYKLQAERNKGFRKKVKTSPFTYLDTV